MEKRKLKVGFTGTQKGMTFKQHDHLADFLEIIGNGISEFHHGDCIGADEEFHGLCEVLNGEIIIHPPINESKRSFCNGIILDSKEYLERNHDIVDQTDCMIVCPDSKKEKLRSGTWATFRYAMKKSKPIFVFYPDGTNKNYNYLEKF